MTYPIVFISYDEPDADQNFRALEHLTTNALRVHGVKGFDAAHKAAAAVARDFDPDAKMFFTVDGDNQLIPSEFQALQLRLSTEHHGLQLQTDKVYSWRAINNVNGLCYGNGGLKLWPMSFVENMKTHEASEGDVVPDFCWDGNYVQCEAIMSHTIINGSAYQAWRSGYREGVKMTLSAGKPQLRHELAEHSAAVNIKRLIAWCSLGRDMRFGSWAMYGALQGFLSSRKINNHGMIISYDEYFPTRWETVKEDLNVHDHTDFEDETFIKRLHEIMTYMRTECRVYNIEIPAFGVLQSQTCKYWMEYIQPQDLLKEETWTQKRLSSAR